MGRALTLQLSSSVSRVIFLARRDNELQKIACGRANIDALNRESLTKMQSNLQSTLCGAKEATMVD